MIAFRGVGEVAVSVCISSLNIRVLGRQEVNARRVKCGALVRGVVPTRVETWELGFWSLGVLVSAIRSASARLVAHRYLHKYLYLYQASQRLVWEGLLSVRKL